MSRDPDYRRQPKQLVVALGVGLVGVVHLTDTGEGRGERGKREGRGGRGEGKEERERESQILVPHPLAPTQPLTFAPGGRLAHGPSLGLPGRG